MSAVRLRCTLDMDALVWRGAVEGGAFDEFDLDADALGPGADARLGDHGDGVPVPGAGSGDLAAAGGVDPCLDLTVVGVLEALDVARGDRAAPASARVDEHVVSLADAGRAVLADGLGLDLVAVAGGEEDLDVDDGTAVGLEDDVVAPAGV